MKNTVKNIVLILLILTLSASTALFAYLHYSRSDGRNLSGEWTAELDMSGRAAVTALGWFQDIEAVSVSLEDLEFRMKGLTVKVNMTLEQTGKSGGTFRCAVLPESYASCRQEAYEAFAEAFRELLAERLRMAGYTGGTDRESIEVLVTETFGMSTVSYLMSCGPALLPSLEELQAGYDGSGTYEAGEGVLTRRYESGGAGAVWTERYIRDGSGLVLTEGVESSAPQEAALYDYPVVYSLNQPESEKERP